MDESKARFTKVLAVTGSILLWIPMLLPLVFAIFSLIQRGKFLFDFLMPGELFFLELAGAAMLIWAAVRARHLLKPIAWGFGVVILALVGSQLLAVVTGIASGKTEAAGLPWILVLAMLGVFWLALIFVGVSGIRLVRHLFKD